MKRSLLALLAAASVHAQAVPEIRFDAIVDPFKLPAGMHFGEVTGIVADVAREEAAFEAVAAARKAFGPIGILVNLAGIRAYEPLAEASAKTWERILAVNLLSYAWFTKAALADLRAQRGNIVNVSSTHAVNARAGMGQYDVTKAGIVSLTKTLAFEEAKCGVRANAVVVQAPSGPHRSS